MAKHYKHDRPFLSLRVDVLEVRQAMEAGYIECPSGGLFDASYPNSTLRRARVVGGGGTRSCTDGRCFRTVYFYRLLLMKQRIVVISDTMPECSLAPIRISASRGRGQYDYCQHIELGSPITTNTITSVQKDNIVWIERFL